MKLNEQIVETVLYEGRSYRSKSGRKRWSQHVIWDDELPGFGLRITSTNRKSFIVRYEDNGRKRTKTLGTTRKLGLEEARRQALELLAPDEEPAATEDATASATETEPEEASLDEIETVAQLADAYLERHLKANVPSWYADQRLIQIHVKPALGRSPIAEVTRTDLTNLRSRVGQRFPGDARRMRLLLDGMFGWADEQGLWSHSPSKRRASRAAKAAPEPPSEPAPRTPEELAAALESSEAERSELAARLDEVSTSGAEMLAKLNEQAEDQERLSAELAKSRRALEHAAAEANKRQDPAKVNKQMVNLRHSVEQLMDQVSAAESERDEMARRLAVAEAEATRQSKKAAAVARQRNALESEALEAQRRAALSEAQRRRRPSRWRAALPAASFLAGVLLTLAMLRLVGGGEDTPRRAAEPPPPGVAAMRPSAPPAEPSSDTSVTDFRTAEAVTNETEPEPRPRPAAAEAAVRAWATAWSEQRVDDYLAAYSETFVPPEGLTRQEWAAQRRSRILAPERIRLTLDQLSRTVLDGDRVRLSFSQGYETESYADRVDKTLEMVWEEGGWKIAAEQAG